MSFCLPLSRRGVIPRITSSADDMVIAIDPDIPGERQRVTFTVKGAKASMLLKLNDAELGPAGSGRLWKPRPGDYRLSIEQEDGTVLDEIRFTVR